MKKTRNKKLLWLVASIVLIALGLLAAAYYFHLWPFSRAEELAQPSSNVINYDAPTDSQIAEGNKTKESTIQNSKQDTPANNGSSSESAGIEITVAEKNGDTYSVRALIQTVSLGTCTIRMVGPNNAIYENTVDVQPIANSSTCKGFNVPMSSLSAGNWTISITFTNDKTTATTKKEVVI